MRPSLTAALVLLGLCAGLVLALDRSPETASRPSMTRSRVLPGVQPGGAILLPNQWSLRPVGKQLRLGDFPVNLALHPSGRWMAVLHAGYGDHEIQIVDLKRQKVVSHVGLDQTFYGLCFAPDGKHLFASGGEFEVIHAFEFADGLLSQHQQLPVVKATERFIPAGLAVDASGNTVYAAGPWGDAVCILPWAEPERGSLIALGQRSYPYACTVDSKRKQLYVSLWNRAVVAVVNL